MGACNAEGRVFFLFVLSIGLVVLRVTGWVFLGLVVPVMCDVEILT